MKKVLLHILFIVGYIALLVGYNSTLKFEKPADYPQGLEYAKAEVVSIVEQDMGEDPDYNYIRIGKQKLELRIISGEYKGKVIETDNFVTRTTQLEGKIGTRYIVGSYDGFITSSIMSYERSGLVILLVTVFIAMVILFGKSKGVASVAALIVTLLNVVFLFMPMLINGSPAILAAIIVVLLSTFYTMVVLNSFCLKSYIATFCCTACTAFAGLLAWLVSLIVDGIIGGVGAVIGFVPQMLVLFIFVPALNAGTVGIMVPVGVLFTIVVARILYKKGVI